MNTKDNNNPAKVYVLTFHEETEMEEPLCFSTYKAAYESMKNAYYDAKSDFDPDSYDSDDTHCDRDCAVIAHKDGWLMWNIWPVVIDAAPEEASV